jgi:hypothetical protein
MTQKPLAPMLPTNNEYCKFYTDTRKDNLDNHTGLLFIDHTSYYKACIEELKHSKSVNEEKFYVDPYWIVTLVRMLDNPTVEQLCSLKRKSCYIASSGAHGKFAWLDRFEDYFITKMAERRIMKGTSYQSELDVYKQSIDWFETHAKAWKSSSDGEKAITIVTSSPDIVPLIEVALKYKWRVVLWTFYPKENCKRLCKLHYDLFQLKGVIVSYLDDLFHHTGTIQQNTFNLSIKVYGLDESVSPLKIIKGLIQYGFAAGSFRIRWVRQKILFVFFEDEMSRSKCERMIAAKELPCFGGSRVVDRRSESSK